MPRTNLKLTANEFHEVAAPLIAFAVQRTQIGVPSYGLYRNPSTNGIILSVRDDKPHFWEVRYGNAPKGNPEEYAQSHMAEIYAAYLRS